MKGKAFMGAEDKDEVIRKMTESRNKTLNDRKMRGEKQTNYPKNRKSHPCSEEKANSISEARKKTKFKYRDMSQSEFENWFIQMLKRGTMYSRGGLNPNLSMALNMRGITINDPRIQELIRLYG